MTTTRARTDADNDADGAASDAEPRAAYEEIAGLPGSAPRWLAALALLASVVARALAPALPGSRAGIAVWIGAFDLSASLLSQLLVLGGALLAFRLIITTLRERELGSVYRLLVVPASAGVLTLIMSSASHQQDAGPALGLAVATALIALGAVPATLARARTRALGIVLALAGVSALVHAAARVMAIKASAEALASLFTASRAVATVSFGLDLAVLAVVLLWLSAANRRAGLLVAAATTVVAAVVAWGALRGSGFDVPFWQVIAARSLSGLAQNPTPLVLPFIRYAVEVGAMLVALAVIAFPRRAPASQGALALALIAGSSADVPLLALCLALSALLGPLIALGATPCGPAGDEPDRGDSAVPE